MSTILDAILCTGWDRMFTDREAAGLTESQLALEAMPAALKWIVGSVDLSWDERIPMLDFANSLFLALLALNPLHREEQFVSPDFVQLTHLSLDDDGSVAVSRDDKLEVARTGCEELLRASAEFGLRMYESFVAAYPSAKDSRVLNSWYLLDRMNAATHGPNGRGVVWGERCRDG